jgi:hypothetical protein
MTAAGATVLSCLAPLPAIALPSSASAVVSSAEAVTPSDGGKVRTIVTTDPELDDLNSLLRMLLYSNEIDIDGLIYSSSQHHFEGDPEAGIDPFRWPDPASVFHIDDAVNQYEKVYDNLVVHDASYPSPAELRSKIRWGNVKTKGDMAEETDGSRYIKAAILDDEPGQLFLQAWGGPNTIARALLSIQEDYEDTPQWAAIQQKVYDKVVLTSFGQQDDTFRDYIRPNWPKLDQREVSTSIWGYGARSSALPQWQYLLSPEWTAANVSTVGPMGASYRVWGDGKQMAAGFDDEDYFGLSGYTADQLRAMGYGVWTPPQPKGAWISEGDSSNFALLMQNGLRNWQDPTYGGWGGRQAVNPADPYQYRNSGVRDIGPNGAPRADYSAGRWFEDFQLDFAARLRWSVTPKFEDANHIPQNAVAEGIELRRAAGSTVTLHGSTSDPDGDAVATKWWEYTDADTFPGAVDISGTFTETATVTIPESAQPGQTIHLIMESTDDGSPALTHYQRVVITVVDAFEPVLTSGSAVVASTTGMTDVTLAGTDLFDIDGVTVGGTAVADVAVSNEGDSLSFRAPASEVVGTVPVELSFAGGGSLGTSISYVAPAITSVSPSRGRIEGGSGLVLTGSDLSSVQSVTVGARPATGVVVDRNGATISAVVPAGTSGATNVVVVFPGKDVTLPGGFTYVDPELTTTITTAKSRQSFGTPRPSSIKVTTADATGAPVAGHVTVFDGATAVTTAVAVNARGRARVKLPADLSVGVHALTASFAPASSEYGSDRSDAVIFTVEKATSTTKARVAAKRISEGRVARVLVSVVADASATGKVTVVAGGKVVGKATLDPDGRATVRVADLESGKHVLRAVYSGSDTVKADASKRVVVTVR